MSTAEDENAAEGKLGSFFSNQPVVTTTEVSILLDQYVTSKKEVQADYQPPPMLAKTQEYVNRFSSIKNKETAQQVRDLLIQHGLSEFELGAVANLMPETCDEAKALIPSLVTLEGKSDEVIQEMLDDLLVYKKFE